jgi:cellulose synthase operon protein C
MVEAGLSVIICPRGLNELIISSHNLYARQAQAMIRNLLLSIALLAFSACGGDDDFDHYVARAQDAIAKSEYTAATLELKNALRLQPDSARARWLLGKVYLETAELSSAEKELIRARELGWTADDLMPALAATFLAQGEFAKARDLSIARLAAGPLATLLALQARAALHQGDTRGAEELLDKALDATPNSVDALIANAQLLASKKDWQAASAVLDQVNSLDARRGEAWSLRGDILTSQRDYKAAVAAYGQALSLQQNDYSDLVKRAHLSLQLGDYESAQRDATALLSRSRNDPAANYIQGLLYFRAARYADAIAALSVTEQGSRRFPPSLFFLAVANLKQGNVDIATGLAERFNELVPDSVQGRKLLASLRLQQGNWTAVHTLLQPVLDNDPDDIAALNLTTNALLREGKIDEGLELLSRLVQLQPDSAEAQARLGAALVLGGKGEVALEHIETALKLDPEFELADILLVRNHLQERDFPAAIAAAEAYRGRHPTSVTPYNLLASVYREAGDPKKAQEALRGALALDKTDPAANHALAQMALAANDIAGARKFYDTALAGHPDSLSTLIELAMLDAREGNETALVAHLEQARAVDAAALQPRLLLARFYLGKGKPEQVAPLFNNLAMQQQQSPEVLRVLAMAQLANRDASAAQFTLEQLLKSTPDSAPIRHAMAMAAAVAGDEQRTIDELRRAIALDEAYVPSRIALARLALVTNSPAEFEEQLAKLIALAPEQPDVLLLQATAAQRRGDISAARSLAEKSFNLAPSTTALASLGAYEEALGDPESARRRYASWLEGHADDIATRMAYANNLLSAKQFDQAAAQYTAVLQVDPNNLMALNNQAWNLKDKNPVQALEYARRAAEHAPDSPYVLDTLALVEYSNKNYRNAERNIKRALAAAPDQPSIVYHSAMIATALNDQPAARAALEKLLAANTDFPEIAEAKALLAQLDH